MNIAALRARIIFQRNSVNVDEIGNHQNTWADYYTCWATISARTAEETQDAAQTLEQSTMNFTVRFCADVAAINSTSYRIIFDGKIYNITSVDPMGVKHKSMKFKASLARR